MRTLPVSTEPVPPARGLSHEYKSKNGICSQRSRIYADVLSNGHEKNSVATGKAGQRYRKKMKKIDALKPIYACISKAIPAATLRAKPHLFSNRTNSAHLLPVNHLEIVNETEGCCLKDSEGKHIVFLLLPRKDVLATSGKTAHGDIAALDKLSERKSTKRSPKRDGFDDNYTNTGLRANRGGHGIVSCKFGDEQPEQWNRLIKMMKRCQGLAAGYLPHGDLTGLTEVMGLSEFKPPTAKVGESPTKKNKRAPTMFAGLANATNYCSPAHTDEDFFILCSLQM